MRLHGKVALVTGAGSGIGKGIADEFRRQGAQVVALDIAQADGDTDVTHLDVTNERRWQEIVADSLRNHGRLDILVNNAGTTGYEPLHELARAEWDRVVGVNQLGTYLGIKATAPAMLSAGGGSIINISSIFGSRAVPGLAAYHATKAAVLGITRNAAVTYAANNIRVNAILPGWIRTPMTESQASELNDKFIAETPMQRGGTPDDIAWAAVYLAADESSFVTGIELPVDGGYLAK